MKVKFKITVEEFSYLLKSVYESTYTGLSELQVLNLRLFRSFALKKLVDLERYFNSEDIKAFSIDINQYAAVMALLIKKRNDLDPFMLQLFIKLQNQNKPLLNLSM